MAIAEMISTLAFSMIISSLSISMVILENLSGILKFPSQPEDEKEDEGDVSALMGCYTSIPLTYNYAWGTLWVHY